MPPETDRSDDQTIAEIRTTFSSRQDAVACGTGLVDRRVAACVQIEGPLTSIYRWQGAREIAEEFVCRCKTTPAAVVTCERVIRSLHPYDTPEILVTLCRGSADYATWVQECVTIDDSEPQE
ncbi:MAG: divalent-cation tolerance protein CutA [Planctomycetota bacterium]|nr:divalent-cation tolerance protein CutA [Planctomycetota bacterium]